MSELPTAPQTRAAHRKGHLRRAPAEFVKVCYTNSLGVKSSMLYNSSHAAVSETALPASYESSRCLP